MTADLVFIFLAGFAMACILVLQALARESRIKLGYAALAATFVFWAWNLHLLPPAVSSWWLYALPILWLILLFRFGFPVTSRREFPSLPGEPYFTQESLRGRPGRREALTFYFLLLLIGLIVGLVFLR